VQEGDEALQESDEALHGDSCCLAAVAETVVPTWDVGNKCLHLDLPQQLADVVSRVRLNVCGMLLPAACTDSLLLKYNDIIGDQYIVTGWRSLQPLVQGGLLLPCSALPEEDGGGGWDLVVHVVWAPPDAFGMKVRGHLG
jgi:hypothetical protein